MIFRNTKHKNMQTKGNKVSASLIPKWRINFAYLCSFAFCSSLWTLYSQWNHWLSLAEALSCPSLIFVPGLGSSPQISVEGLKDGEVKLKCTSEGTVDYVQWRDMEGNPIPSFSPGPDSRQPGAIHVEAFLLVTNSSVVNVTCSISSPFLGEEKKTTFYTSGLVIPCAPLSFVN